MSVGLLRVRMSSFRGVLGSGTVLDVPFTGKYRWSTLTSMKRPVIPVAARIDSATCFECVESIGRRASLQKWQRVIGITVIASRT